MVSCYIIECVNTVNKFRCNIGFVNHYACNSVAVISCDCERNFCSFNNYLFSARSDSSVFTSSCCDCVGRNFLEVCSNCVVCCYIFECVNTVNKFWCNISFVFCFSINYNACNSVSFVSSYCEYGIFAFNNSCFFRSDCTTFTSSCCDCVGYCRYFFESSSNCVVFCYVNECVNTVFIKFYSFTVNENAKDSIAFVCYDCECSISSAVNCYVFGRSDSSVFNFGNSNRVGNLLEGCCNGVGSIYVCECVNTVNKFWCNSVTINYNASNSIAVISCDCERLFCSFNNFLFSTRSDSSVFTSSCCDCIGCCGFRNEGCFNAVTFSYICECVNTVFIKFYSFTVNENTKDSVTFVSCNCECLSFAAVYISITCNSFFGYEVSDRTTFTSSYCNCVWQHLEGCCNFVNVFYICKCVNVFISYNSFGNISSINCYAFDSVAIVTCYCERLVFATVCIIAVSIISCDCSVFTRSYFNCIGNLLECSFDEMICIYASDCINTIIGNNVVCNFNIINCYAFDSVAIVSTDC